MTLSIVQNSGDEATVSILVTAPDEAPHILQETTVRPIEDELCALPEVEHVTSEIALGRASVMVEFHSRAPPEQARQAVNAAVDRSRVRFIEGDSAK